MQFSSSGAERCIDGSHYGFARHVQLLFVGSEVGLHLESRYHRAGGNDPPDSSGPSICEFIAPKVHRFLSPGQRPGFRGFPQWIALKGRNPVAAEIGPGRHGEFRPFRARGYWGEGFPGRCPGLTGFAPLVREIAVLELVMKGIARLKSCENGRGLPERLQSFGRIDLGFRVAWVVSAWRRDWRVVWRC